MDKLEQERFLKRVTGLKLQHFLKKHITNKSTLEDIINVFEQMCKIPIDTYPLDEETILFQTGVDNIFDTEIDECLKQEIESYTVNEEPADDNDSYFHIELSKLCSYQEETICIVNVYVIYRLTKQNKQFGQTVFDDEFESNEEFFDYVRKSKDVAYAKKAKMRQIAIY